MGWETRGNREYYYRKEWINGACVSSYIGSGELADLLSQSDELYAAKAERERRLERNKREADKSLDDELDRISEINRTLVDALFLVNGFHQHKRQWRKSR